MQSPKARAVIYTRYSTIHQTEESIADQRGVCLEYATKHGLAIVDEYSDPAISGTAEGNRPQFLRMQADAVMAKFDVILALDSQRIARGFNLPTFCKVMYFYQVQVIGCRDAFDSYSDGAGMQAGLNAIIGENATGQGGKRVHIALERRAREGRPTGSTLYGYTSKHAIIPAQAAVVREIFEAYAAGRSMLAIVDDLNARTVAGPGRRADRRWIIPTIRTTLLNERYGGTVIWNRRKFKKHALSGVKRAVLRPREEWIVQVRPDLAIVERKLFDAVQARLHATAKGRGGRKGPGFKFPLSGFLKCGVCGKNLQVVTAPATEKTGGARSRAYICGTARSAGTAACANDHRVAIEEIERVVLAPILRKIESPEAERDLIAWAVKNFKREAKAAAATAAAQKIPVDLSALDAEVANVRALVLEGRIPQAAAELLFADIASRRKAARQVVPRTIAPQADVFTVAKECRATLRALRADLHSGDPLAVRGIVAKQYPEGEIIVEPNSAGSGLAVRIPRQPVALAFAVGSVTNEKSTRQSFISYPLKTLGGKGRT